MTVYQMTARQVMVGGLDTETTGVLAAIGYTGPAERLTALIEASAKANGAYMAMMGRSKALFEQPPLDCPDEVHAALRDAIDRLQQAAGAYAAHWIGKAVAAGELTEPHPEDRVVA